LGLAGAVRGIFRKRRGSAALRAAAAARANAPGWPAIEKGASFAGENT
jgi:hypothetical protein